jgi:hypothetical protein
MKATVPALNPLTSKIATHVRGTLKKDHLQCGSKLDFVIHIKNFAYKFTEIGGELTGRVFFLKKLILMSHIYRKYQVFLFFNHLKIIFKYLRN